MRIPEGVFAQLDGKLSLYRGLDTTDHFASHPEKRVEDVVFRVNIKRGHITMDMGFYKRMLDKHIEYLHRLNLPTDNMKQLAFQIVSYELLLDGESITLEAVDDSNTEQHLSHHLKTYVRGFLQQRVNEVIKKRVDMVNDPREIVEDLEFENFSVSHLEKSFKHLMSKLQFTLPDRLYIPNQ
jgi:hypothetical protein